MAALDWSPSAEGAQEVVCLDRGGRLQIIGTSSADSTALAERAYSGDITYVSACWSHCGGYVACAMSDGRVELRQSGEGAGQPRLRLIATLPVALGCEAPMLASVQWPAEDVLFVGHTFNGRQDGDPGHSLCVRKIGAAPAFLGKPDACFMYEDASRADAYLLLYLVEEGVAIAAISCSDELNTLTCAEDGEWAERMFGIKRERAANADPANLDLPRGTRAVGPTFPIQEAANAPPCPRVLVRAARVAPCLCPAAAVPVQLAVT